MLAINTVSSQKETYRFFSILLCLVVWSWAGNLKGQDNKDTKWLPFKTVAEQINRTYNDRQRPEKPIEYTSIWLGGKLSQSIGLFFNLLAHDAHSMRKLEEIEKKSSAVEERSKKSTLLTQLYGGKKNPNLNSEVTSHLASSSGKVLGQQLHSRVGVLSALKRGFSYKLETQSTKLETKQYDPIRYGLILKNIEPSKNSLKLVSISGEAFSEYKYAVPVKTTWEVGPITDLPNQKVFPPSESKVPMEFPPKKASGWEAIVNKLDAINYPKANFEIKLIPILNENISSGISKNIPFRLFLEQEEKFYRMEVDLENGLSQTNATHHFALPVLNLMKLGHRLDRSYKSTASSVEDLRLFESTLIDIRYSHLADNYVSGINYHNCDASGSGWAVGLVATSPSTINENIKEKYELKLSTSF